MVKGGQKMNQLKKVSILTILLTILLSFNSIAMDNAKNNFNRPTPESEEKHEDRSLDYRWTWINDEKCARFQAKEDAKKIEIERKQNIGGLENWGTRTEDTWKVKTRDSYSGKWNQSTEGIWSFTFDDSTIPVGVTKIDGILYAFNTYGELKDGYEYYTGFKTEADGIVKVDSAEFTQWLATQYLPECTSHE